MSNEKIDLLPLYYTRLRSTFENLSSNSDMDEKVKNQKEEIGVLLEEKESWENGNEIERKMIFIMDDNDLDFEINQKLLSSKHYFVDEYIALYQELKKIAPENKEIKKKRLFRLIQDIQWQIGKRRLMQPEVKKAKNLMMFCMGISIVLILWTNGLVDTKGWYFPLVMSAGFMGAVFSMLSGLSSQSNELILDDLQNLYIKEILVRIALGVGAALLLYYFFQSKLFPFELFPDINKLDQFLSWKQCISSTTSKTISAFSEICKNNPNGEVIDFCNTFTRDISKIDRSIISKVSEGICTNNKEFNNSELSKWDVNLYKLIIMSFLAGFSEKLVPNMLDKTKSKINDGV